MAVRVKFQRKPQIEARAQQLLDEFRSGSGAPLVLPIPVEDILEVHLKLTLEIDNLEKRIGHPDILGALFAPERLVAIDESLEPTENPHKTGRFRYTLGHEIGHWVQHRHYFVSDPNQALLFPPQKPQATVVCRSSQTKDPIEWQADYFSACLLMPREMVFDAWEKHRGSAAPVVCTEDYLRKLEEISGPRPADQLAADLFDYHAGELAPIFQVSTQAMRIRLEELRLLQRGSGLSLDMEEVA